MSVTRGVPTARELLVACVIAFALAVVFTWPLAARFSTAGRVDSGDGRYSIWNVAWVAHALTSPTDDVWNANIFYPHTGTLAFSEANLVAGLIGTPVWLLTRNPIATSNWAVLCSFALAALAMYLLVLYLTSNRWGAAMAGVLYAFCSYSFAHLAHIQLLMTFGPPLALFAMHRFIDGPSVKRAVWLGLALAVQALACGYYGIFGGLAVAFGIAWLGGWTGQARAVRFWLLTALAAMIAVGVVAPFLVPYLRLQEAGFARTLDDARLFRASWRSYLASALLVYQWILPLIGHWREVLFPGFLSIGMAGVAIVRALKRHDVPGEASRRDLVVFYVLLALLAGWASLGPDAGLYRLLFDTVPFMNMLRAPARLGLLVTLSTAALAGMGLASLEPAWKGRRRTVYLTALVVLTLARSTVGPLELHDARPPSRAVTWLSKLPRGAVASFPFHEHHEMSLETGYMLQSAWHWQPMLNGYSDFVPDDVANDLAPLRTFPSTQALKVLRERQARYIVINWDRYTPEERDEVREFVGSLPATFRPMLNDPDASLFELDTPIAGIR